MATQLRLQHTSMYSTSKYIKCTEEVLVTCLDLLKLSSCDNNGEPCASSSKITKITTVLRHHWIAMCGPTAWL